MKLGNILLAGIVLVIGAFVCMLVDTDTTRTGGSSGSGGGSSASFSNAELRAAITSGRPVLLEFYAEWCGPCRTVGPVVDELARELRGTAHVVRLDVDVHKEVAMQYGVQGIPAFIALKGGKEIAREVGAIPKSAMRAMLGM